MPGESGYLVSSLLLIFYIMVPFFLSFEKRKSQAREVVLIAVMIALAVASRAAFFMIPQFKPMLAIIIIAGVCLGAQSGFLVGSMSAFDRILCRAACGEFAKKQKPGGVGNLWIFCSIPSSWGNH
ncbi:hypothetical protein JZU68_07655, partial [bacterium]|nr:hypothetical protein [bacterium]